MIATRSFCLTNNSIIYGNIYHFDIYYFLRIVNVSICNHCLMKYWNSLSYTQIISIDRNYMQFAFVELNQCVYWPFHLNQGISCYAACLLQSEPAKYFYHQLIINLLSFSYSSECWIHAWSNHDASRFC